LKAKSGFKKILQIEKGLFPNETQNAVGYQNKFFVPNAYFLAISSGCSFK